MCRKGLQTCAVPRVAEADEGVRTHRCCGATSGMHAPPVVRTGRAVNRAHRGPMFFLDDPIRFLGLERPPECERLSQESCAERAHMAGSIVRRRADQRRD